MPEHRAAILTVFRPAKGPDCTNGGLSSQHAEILAVEGDVLPAEEASGLPIFKIVRRRLAGGSLAAGAVQASEIISLTPYVADLRPHFAFGGNFAWSSHSAPRGWWGERPIPIHDHAL